MRRCVFPQAWQTGYKAQTSNVTLINWQQSQLVTLGHPSQGYFNLVGTQRGKIEMNSREKEDLREGKHEIRYLKDILCVQVLRKKRSYWSKEQEGRNTGSKNFRISTPTINQELLSTWENSCDFELCLSWPFLKAPEIADINSQKHPYSGFHSNEHSVRS